MKLVTYAIDERVRLGVLNAAQDWVYPVQSLGLDYTDMLSLIKKIGYPEVQLLEHECKKDPEQIKGAAALKNVRLLAPIPHPEQDVICLGVNYMDHAAESARFKGEAFNGQRPYAVYFSKRVNAASGAFDPIPAHEDLVDSLDYEAELAIVLCKDAKNVPKEKVREYVFGYTVLNDVSARNVQNRHKQWYFGKSLDGFTPMGPCLVTADSVPYPPALQITSKVNGELRQNSNTSLLIFDIDHIVSELSQGMTLKAGTIISTGTPAGVGMGFVPPRFLKPGDVVECAIEGIGTLKNTVIS